MQISSRAVMFGVVAGQHGLSTPSKDFYGVEIWRLARPLQDLKCFLRSHSFVAGRCVWDHCHAERPSHVSSSMPLLMEGGFHLKSHDTWPHSFFPLHRSVVWSLCRKTAPKHVSTPMLHSRYGVLWMQLSILSPPNTS